jgi:hypothetical protein
MYLGCDGTVHLVFLPQQRVTEIHFFLNTLEGFPHAVESGFMLR